MVSKSGLQNAGDPSSIPRSGRFLEEGMWLPTARDFVLLIPRQEEPRAAVQWGCESDAPELAS